MNQNGTIRSIFAIRILLLVVVASVQYPAFAVRNFKIGDPLTGLFSPGPDGKVIYETQKPDGRPTVVVFWRPNHEFSLEVLRDIESLAKDIGPAKFAILAVDTKRSTAADIKTVIKNENISVPVLLDPQRILYERVGVLVSPTTLLFDAEGKLRFIVPGHPRPFRQVVQARLCYLLGEIDEQTMAEQVKPTVIKVEHDWASAWRMYNLGKRLQMEGSREQAAAIYTKAVTQHPAITEAHCALGFLELEAGNLQTAAQHFERALSHQANSSAAQLGRAVVLARTNKSESAEQILLSLKGEQSRSIFVRVRYELGRIYRSRGEFEKAARYYQDALARMFGEVESDPARAPVDHSKALLQDHFDEDKGQYAR